MLYPRGGAGLFSSLDLLGKPSLASVSACSELWISIPWVHTPQSHHLWRVQNVCHVKSGNQALNLSALHHSGNFVHRRYYILVWCISQQNQLPCNSHFFPDCFVSDAAFPGDGGQPLPTSPFKSLCVSIQLLHRAIKIQLELFLFRKFPYVSLFDLSKSWWLLMQRSEGVWQILLHTFFY